MIGQWERVQPLLPWRARGRKSARGDRLFVDAVVYRAKTGVPWRDLPERFGPWKSVYNRFALTPGERHEMIAARELLDFASGDALIGDTAYDSNEFRAELKARDIKAVIHSKPERKRALPLDRKLYGQR